MRFLAAMWLLKIDRETHYPQLKLLQARLPSPFERFDPQAVSARIGNVNYNLHKIVAVDDAFLPPMSLDLLRFVTCRPEMIHNFQHRFSQPVGWNLCAVVEL